MSLKSIRESYSKLLAVFNEAGVKLSESQKGDLDTFVLAIESTMEKQRAAAIRQTKRAVESRMEKEYKSLFESIMANMQKNAELASKIENKVTQINESKKIAGKVNDYLDLYVESVLPKKTIVDYDRMRKLEKIHESLKDALLVTEDSVADKIEALEESYRVKASKCETEVAKMQVKLNESMKNELKMKKRLDAVKAVELLESKTKDLPSFEARQVKKHLKEATTSEIEKNFEKTLESVRKGMKKADEEMEKTVESEIADIIEKDVEENDILKDKPHNAHVPAKKVEEADAEEVEEEEDFETMEIIKTNEDGDVELDESDVIDSGLMNLWCRQSVEVR